MGAAAARKARCGSSSLQLGGFISRRMKRQAGTTTMMIVAPPIPNRPIPSWLVVSSAEPKFTTTTTSPLLALLGRARGPPLPLHRREWAPEASGLCLPVRISGRHHTLPLQAARTSCSVFCILILARTLCLRGPCVRPISAWTRVRSPLTSGLGFPHSLRFASWFIRLLLASVI